ncbi:MAG: ABC transporter permease [Acidimicrobiales bacterium]|nr:ABC transporter permease [Acidimicrobiales bacterium]
MTFPPEPQVNEPTEPIRERRLGLGFWLPMGWIILIVGAALLAPVLPIKDPTDYFIRPGERPPYPPSADHWFGTDQDARDMFSRIISGARVSLAVGFMTVAMSFIVGGALGMVAGLVRGWFDRLASFLFLVLLSFPGLVLVILIIALIDRSVLTISVTLAIGGIAPVGRLARAATLSFAEREFVIAARTLGARNSRILFRELLPNVIIPMGALVLLGVAAAIVGEGTLAFLGLSVEKAETWGKLIRNGAGSRVLRDSPWVAFGPITVMFLTLASLNYIGDYLRDFFNVRETGLG